MFASRLAYGVLFPLPRWSKRTIRYFSGVEEAAHLAVGPSAGPAVEEDDRLAGRVPALLEVELVQVGDAEPAGPVRLDLGVEPADGILHQVGHANLRAHPDRTPGAE